MSSEWSKISLKDVLQFVVDNRGKTVPTIKTEGIPLIATNCVNNSDIYPVFKNVRQISEETYNNWFRAHPKPNDILFTLKGSQNGAACLVPDPVNFAIAQDMVALRVNEKIMDPYFLLVALRSRNVQYQIKTLDVSDVIPHLKKGDFDKLMLPYPPLAEQKAIGELYMMLERKKHQNTKMNQTLEDMAQALFTSWFVDFDPVIDNALLAGHELPEALQVKVAKRRSIQERQGLTADERFPDRFVFEEALGKYIPEGWEVRTVAEALEINPKVTIKRGEVAKSVDMKALPTTGFSVDGIITKEFKGGSKFEQGDVLLARITPCLQNGKTGIVDFLNDDERAFGSTEFIVLRGKNEIKTPFVACLSREESFVNHCIQNMVGSSGRQRVMNSCFDSFYLYLPANDLLNNFHKTVRSHFSKMTSNSNQTQTLTQLRDTLLPQLISGKLTVPAAMLAAEKAIS